MRGTAPPQPGHLGLLQGQRPGGGVLGLTPEPRSLPGQLSSRHHLLLPFQGPVAKPVSIAVTCLPSLRGPPNQTGLTPITSPTPEPQAYLANVSLLAEPHKSQLAQRAWPSARPMATSSRPSFVTQGPEGARAWVFKPELPSATPTVRGIRA